MSKTPNVFDWDEDEESKKFEKNLIYGEQDEPDIAKDFLKKSLQAANMNAGSVDEEDGDWTLMGKSRTASVGYSVRGHVNKTTIPARPTVSVHTGAGRDAGRAGGAGSGGGGVGRVTKESGARDSPPGPRSDRTSSKMDVGNSIDDNMERVPQISALDYKKMQDDLAAKNRMIEKLREEKWKSIPVNETIKRIINGDPYTLDTYKSLDVKEELLAKAMKSKDGNAILTVVIFLERTLSTRIFQQELKKNSDALNHYVQHLRSTEEWRKLEQLYKDMEMVQEAAFLQYERANLVLDLTQRIMELQKWLDQYREARQPDVEEMRSYIIDEIKLLEKQNQIEVEDKKKELTNQVMQQQGRKSVERSSLITTISYCALHHHDKSDMFRAAEIRKQFQVTDKQYEWAVLPPLAKLRQWPSIQELLTSSGWFGKKSEVSHMGFENVVNVLVQNHASSDVIMKYCNLISDLELRVKLGRELNMHDVVIDALFQLRDKQRLEQYRSVVGDSRLHQQRINDILHNSSIKWR